MSMALRRACHALERLGVAWRCWVRLSSLASRRTNSGVWSWMRRGMLGVPEPTHEPCATTDESAITHTQRTTHITHAIAPRFLQSHNCVQTHTNAGAGAALHIVPRWPVSCQGTQISEYRHTELRRLAYTCIGLFKQTGHTQLFIIYVHLWCACGVRTYGDDRVLVCMYTRAQGYHELCSQLQR